MEKAVFCFLSIDDVKPCKKTINLTCFSLLR